MVTHEWWIPKWQNITHWCWLPMQTKHSTRLALINVEQLSNESPMLLKYDLNKCKYKPPYIKNIYVKREKIYSYCNLVLNILYLGQWRLLELCSFEQFICNCTHMILFIISLEKISEAWKKKSFNNFLNSKSLLFIFKLEIHMLANNGNEFCIENK